MLHILPPYWQLINWPVWPRTRGRGNHRDASIKSMEESLLTPEEHWLIIILTKLILYWLVKQKKCFFCGSQWIEDVDDGIRDVTSQHNVMIVITLRDQKLPPSPIFETNLVNIHAAYIRRKRIFQVQSCKRNANFTSRMINAGLRGRAVASTILSA